MKGAEIYHLVGSSVSNTIVLIRTSGVHGAHNYKKKHVFFVK